MDERMAALRQRFVDDVAAQAIEIEALLKAGEPEAARQIAHGLAGRAGMFGHGELGEIARAADEAAPGKLTAALHALTAALRRVAQDGC